MTHGNESNRMTQPVHKESGMSHFAIRQSITPGTPAEEIELSSAAGEGDGTRLLAAYYTPGPGQLLSVYESGGSATTATEPGREVLPVIPITPEEYGPPGVEPAAGDGDALQLVLVRRHLDPITHREFRALALQAIMCAHEYSDLLWVRSYWATEQNELLCVFRTREHELVREHARRSRIPCDEVHDAVQLEIPQPHAAAI